MSLDDFLSHGEARVLWSRFESLVGQQVFRLRVEGEAANVPSSLCSLLSSNMSSPDRMTQFEPSCFQPGHLQQNSNALEIDKQPLYDVHKKALLLESQLHQYINPTLTTTLNKRSAKATYEAELISKLIDKLRKVARRSALEPGKRKRACDLTKRLKDLLCHQKCEWQCVGRLKETLAISQDMKGVLKFICQLSCLLEHCSEASRRFPEHPPPYEYCSPYDSTSKQDSCDALYEDLKLLENQCPPYRSQSSHSQVTISLSLDFTSDPEFVGKSPSSGDSTRTRTSSHRHRSQSCSRDYTNVKRDSEPATSRSWKHSREYTDAKKDLDSATLSSRRRSKEYTNVKNDSDPGTLRPRRHSRDYMDIKSDSGASTVSSRKHSRGYSDVKSDSGATTVSSRKHNRGYNDVKNDSGATTVSSRKRSKAHNDVKSESGATTVSSRKHSRGYSDVKSDSGATTISSRKHSRGYNDVKSNSGATTVSSRKRSKGHNNVKSESGATTVSSQRHRKTRHDSMPREATLSKSHRRAKSASSFSSRSSDRRSRKRSVESEGKASSRQQTVLDPPMMEASGGTYDAPKTMYSRATRSVSPVKSASPRERLLSQKLAEETINELIGVLEDYIENKSEGVQLSESRNSPFQSSYRSGDASRSEPISRQTFHVYSSLPSESPSSRQWSKVSPVIPDRPSSASFSPTAWEHSVVLEAQNDLQDSHTSSRQSFGKDFSSGQGWSSVTPQKSEIRHSLKDSRLSQETFDGDRMGMQSVDEMRIGHDDLQGSQQNLNDVKISRNSLNETRLSRQNFSDAHMSSQDFKSSTMSKQSDTASMRNNLENILQDQIKSSRNSLNETRLSRQNVSDAHMSSPDFKSSTMSKQSDMASMSKNLQNILQDQIKSSRNSLKKTRLSRHNFSDARMSSPDFKSSLSKQDELAIKNLQRVSQDFSQTRTSQGELSSTRISKPDETRTSRHSVGEARISQEQARASQYDYLKAKASQENMDDSSQAKSSQRDAKSSRSGRLNSEGKRKSMEDHSDKDSKRESDQTKMVSNVSDHRPCKRLCDELRRSRKSMNGNELGEMSGKRRTMDERGLEKTRRRGKDSDTAEMSSVRQLVKRECADVVRRRIASISPPPSESKHTQSSKQPCASSSPSSHVRQDIDKICSRFEKGSLDNSESTDTKNTSELSAHSKKKRSKIMNSPLSVISESKDYPSSNTEVQEPEQDMETNNMEDVSTNKNVSDPRRSDSFDRSPGHVCDIRMSTSQDKFRQKRTSPHLMPRKSEDRPFYMQPRCDNSPHLMPRKSEDRPFYMQLRCDNSDSSGSRDPLLFSSQETDLDYDDVDDDDCDCSELSYKPPHVVNKHRTKVSRGKRMSRKKCFAENESDLLEDTSTTTDSCAYDEGSISVSLQRSYSGGQHSSKTHQMDDTEGDIDQESDFEVELELQDSSVEFTDKGAEHSPELSIRWDRRPSPSRSSHRPSSVNESSSPRDWRSLSPWQGSGQSRRQSSPKSPLHKHSEDMASLRQSLNELNAQQTNLSPSNDQLSEDEDLMMADILLRQSPYETDLHASDLVFGRSPTLPEQYGKAASYTYPQAGSRRSSGKPASLHSPYRGEDSPFSAEPSQMSVRSSIKRAQSTVQSEHAASSRTSTPRQKSASPSPPASAKVSSGFTQPQSPGASTQSPPYGIPIASSVPGSSVRFGSSRASQHSRSPSAASTHPAGSVHGYPSEYPTSRTGSPAPIYQGGSVYGYGSEYATSKAGTPIPVYPDGSVHGYPCAESERPQTLPSTSGLLSRRTSKSGSAASYQAGSMHGYPSAVSERPKSLPPTPGTSSHHASRVCSPGASYPAGSVHGYPSAVSDHPQTLPSTPGTSSHHASRVCSRVCSPAASYQAGSMHGGSVHGYPSALSEQPQTLRSTPRSSAHGPSKAGSSVASYPAESVHGYPSTELEQLPSTPGSSEHASRAYSAALHLAGSVHGYPSTVSEQPKMLPSASGLSSHYASVTGSSAVTHPGGSVHEYHSAVSEHPQTLPSTPGSSTHGPSKTGSSPASYPAGSVHGYPSTELEHPQTLPSTPGSSAHGPSKTGSSPASYPAGSVQGYPSAMSEQPQMLTTTSGLSSHYASVTGSSAATHPGGSVHEYHSAVSEQPQTLPSTPGSSTHGPLKTGSSPASYPAGSVHGYPSTVSEHPQTLPSTPGSSPNNARAGSAASHPAGSVHGYPSAVSDQPQMLPSASGKSSHYASVTGSSAATHPGGSVYEYHSAVSEHPQVLPSTPASSSHPASIAGSVASHPDGSVHGYPSPVSEQPQMLPSVTRASKTSTLAASYPDESVHKYPSSVSEHPQMLPSVSEISQPTSMKVSLAASGISVHGYLYASEHPASRTGSPAASHPARSVTGNTSAVPEQPQISSITGAPSHGASNGGATAPAGSVPGYPSVVSEQPQIRTLTPGISEHSSRHIGSPAPISPGGSTQGYPSVASELPSIPGASTHQASRAASPAASYPSGSVHLSFTSQQPQMLPSYIEASVHSDSSAASGLPETSPLTSRVSQQTTKLSEQSVLTARSPSVHPAGSVRSDLSAALTQPTDFTDELQQETARGSQPGQHMDNGVRQSRHSAASDVSRHTPYPAGASETPRHASFLTEMSGASIRSPSPAEPTVTSRHSSDYSYVSTHSPSKSLRPSVTQKSITPEEAEMSTDYIHGEVSRSSTRASPPRSSLPKRQMSMKDIAQERYEQEEHDSQMDLSSTSAHEIDGELGIRERWWIYVPLLILALILLYYIICYLVSTGDCMNCRAPVPNIFFYLINSAVHSVRLIHASPAPT